MAALDEKSMNSVPMLRAPVDVMRTGLGKANLKAEAAPVHPVQLVQLQAEPKRMETKKALLAKVYGAHLPLKLTMEEAILSQFQRMPGLQSSLVGLETMLNRDTTIDYADYLGDPELSEKMVDVHSMMEARLGDNKSNLKQF